MEFEFSNEKFNMKSMKGLIMTIVLKNFWKEFVTRGVYF